MNEKILLYVTYPDHKSAESLSYKLIEKKLVACANIFPQVTSIYSWKGDIEKENEVVAIYKSRESHFRKIKDFIEANHSYDTPCVVSLKLADGNTEFLKWISKQTEQESQ